VELVAAHPCGKNSQGMPGYRARPAEPCPWSLGHRKTAWRSVRDMNYDEAGVAFTYHIPFSSMQGTGEKLPLLFKT
jgi:hypothetical protein